MSEPEIQNQIKEWINGKLEEYEVDKDRLAELEIKLKVYRGIMQYWNNYMKHLETVGRKGPDTQKALEWCEREKQGIIKVIEHYEKQIARQDLVDKLKKFLERYPPSEIL